MQTATTRKLVSTLRALCSSDAEVLSDYERINQFVKFGWDAANTIEKLEEQLAHHLWQRGYGPNPQKDGAK
jgi:hypothetical protein